MGNGHLPGPKLSSGDEKQPALPATYSNPDAIKKFVNWASQNGISVNGRGTSPSQKIPLTHYCYQGPLRQATVGKLPTFPDLVASNHNLYPNQKSKSSVPPSDTTVLVTDLNPWEDMRKPPTLIGLPPICYTMVDGPTQPESGPAEGNVNPSPFPMTQQTITFAPHTILSSPQPKWVDHRDLAECERRLNHQICKFEQHQRIWDWAHMQEVDSLAETCRDLEDCQKMVLEDQQAVKGDREQLLQSVQCSAESVVKTSDSTANQLSQLAGFVKELNRAMDTMVTVPITPSTALRSIVWHLGFIIQEHNIQTSPVCTFFIYRLIAPPLKYLLLTLQWHEHLKIIPKILPPPQELSWFCKLIRSLRSQLTEEELAAAPGLFMDFEMEQYLLDVTIQDPLTLPLSPTYTPSDTNSLEVEVTLTVEPMGLPILDPEAVHEAPMKSNLS
ncbi:hypothetical protein BS47DRAFT_1364940 [Hydnum rufescens UP504]|uniref:Uncharacterized protein n=1 Tax=Hydnum rufescens UP504 TaxID=1448309 RepID=A0A9P6AQJ5_9AGAM|nr:hypothetical protein BS47DRAFT_1364940 [Hydnum rufescens UP504]